MKKNNNEILNKNEKWRRVIYLIITKIIKKTKKKNIN